MVPSVSLQTLFSLTEPSFQISPESLPPQYFNLYVTCIMTIDESNRFVFHRPADFQQTSGRHEDQTQRRHLNKDGRRAVTHSEPYEEND